MTNTGPAHPDLPLVTLDDLPERRREALLWRCALELDYNGVDADVRERSTQPCRWQWLGEADERVAVLGDDGRHHLLIDGQLLCAKPNASKRRFQVPQRDSLDYRHEQWCHWWTDGTHYRIQAPHDAARDHDGRTAGSGSRWIGWNVVLTQHRTDPSLIPRNQRCPIQEPSGHWPPPHNPASALGRVRIRLIEALGADCHACRQSPGVIVDHDPFSTYIRGLLCRNCNTHADECPHLARCPWADYLNDPPAAPLRLIYPAWRKVLQHQSTHRKIQMLGIDPFAELRTRPPG